jgi:hypothetical protein
MPIDPNIFFQGAAIRAAKEKQIADTVGQIFQNYNAAKQRTADREAQKAADYEGAYMRVLTAANSGVAPDPADLPKAQAFEQLRTSEIGVDPLGNFYPKAKPLLGGVQGVISQMGNTPTEYVSPYAAPEIMPTNSAMPPMPKGRSNVVNDLGGELSMPPLGDNYDEMGQISPNLEPSVANSTWAKKQITQAEIDLQKQMALEEKKNEIAMRSKEEGKKKFDDAVSSIMYDLNALNKIGGITNTQRKPSENIVSYAASTALGREAGKAIGTEAQAVRDNIANKKLALTKAIMQATGMSSKQMDSNAELKTFLDSLGSPTSTYQSNVETLEYLSNQYGGGVKNKTNTENKDDIQSLIDKYAQ